MLSVSIVKPSFYILKWLIVAVNEAMDVPESHPRFQSLLKREKIVKGIEVGLVVPQGLIAQGRGEAFDYLLGEKTIPPALKAEKVAAAHLVLSSKPVISVNGNVAALASTEIIRLGKAVPTIIEVNLYYWTEERVRKIITHFRKLGAKGVIGDKPNARLPGIESKRSRCSLNGIYSADVVFVSLEDGDRTQALAAMGKTVLAVDLNPMSRTATTATVTIVDELTRALPNITRFVRQMKENRSKAARLVKKFDNDENLQEVHNYLHKRLKKLSGK